MISVFEEKNKRFFDRHAARYDNPLSRWAYFERLYRRAMKIIQHHVSEKLAQGITVADIPCGTAEMIYRLAIRYSASQYIGIDLSDAMIEKAQEKCAALPNVSFQVASVQAIPIRDQTVDVVLCVEAFHHFEDPSHALDEFNRIIKPGGMLLLVDPAFNRPVWKRLAKKILRPLEFAHDYFSTNELTALLAQHGFLVESKDVYWLNSFVVARKSP